jgi:hypothetical protein
MDQVGAVADRARARGQDVIAALRQAGFDPKLNCEVNEATYPPAQAQPQQQNLHSSLLDDAVGETGVGLTLTAQLVGPNGVALPTVSNMPPDAAPVPIPSGSSLTLSWDPGSNPGCSIVASFPPGVSVPNPQPSGVSGDAGSDSNWLPEESPQVFGPLTEPGEYTFDFDCGFQTDAEVVTETHISLNLVPPPPVSPDPPMLMTLFTATTSDNSEAVDWTSYAYPGNSYTDPKVSPGQVPETDIAAGPSDAVMVSWVAEDNVPGSCIFSEIDGSAGGLSPIASDAGQTSVTLGSAAARVFQLSCTDLNGLPHLVWSGN